MKVILQEKVNNLGGIGDLVNVKPGFARNFLIPQGKAMRATEENMVLVAARRLELEKTAAEALDSAKQRAEALGVISVTITANAGEEGKLFGSVGNRDIAEAITLAGQSVDKSEVELPEGPLRQVGEYDIAIKLHSEVRASVKIHVVGEEATS